MALVNKAFRAKFYDKAGAFIGDLVDFDMGGFRKIINGGLGDLTLTLPLKIDQAYSSPFTQLANRIEVYCTDRDTDPNGVQIYSGLINTRNPTMKGTVEKTILTCRGHAARFNFLPLKNSTTVRLNTDTSAGLTTGGTASAAALEKVLKAIIDRYQAEAVYPVVNYVTGSVATSGVTWTYGISNKSIMYALQLAMENAPAGSFWTVDALNRFNFKLLGTTVDHYLAMGSQIIGFDDTETLDGLVNRFLFAYNGSPATVQKLTSDTTSSGRYGDWWQWKNDGRYTVTGDAQQVATAVVTANKIPPHTLMLDVADNNFEQGVGYDIERLDPGQMVLIENLPAALQGVFPGLLQIVAVDYAPNGAYATIYLNKAQASLERAFADKETRDTFIETDDNPTTYT